MSGRDQVLFVNEECGSNIALVFIPFEFNNEIADDRSGREQSVVVRLEGGRFDTIGVSELNKGDDDLSGRWPSVAFSFHKWVSTVAVSPTTSPASITSPS